MSSQPRPNRTKKNMLVYVIEQMKANNLRYIEFEGIKIERWPELPKPELTTQDGEPEFTRDNIDADMRALMPNTAAYFDEVNHGREN